jgi:hypothetical protein
MMICIYSCLINWLLHIWWVEIHVFGGGEAVFGAKHRKVSYRVAFQCVCM